MEVLKLHFFYFFYFFFLFPLFCLFFSLSWSSSRHFLKSFSCLISQLPLLLLLLCVCESTFRYVVELIYSVLISPDIAFPPNKLCRRHLFRIKRKRRRRRREILEAAWDALNFFLWRIVFYFISVVRDERKIFGL